MTAETKPGRGPEASAFPREIWLQHPADADPEVGQLWAEDDPFDGGHPAARYVLAPVPAVPAPAGNGVREAGITWPNGCNKTVPEALRFLANHDRPMGGEQNFNSAHLYQLASEIERVSLATPVSAEEDGLNPHTYAQEYEFRSDEVDYTPTEAERGMIEDAICGYLSELEAAALTPTPAESAKPDTSAAGHEARFLIRKGGVYYRPNSQGYTTSVSEAGRYTLAEAEEITHPNGPDGPRDGMSYIEAPAESAPSGDTVADLKENSEGLWANYLRVLAERDSLETKLERLTREQKALTDANARQASCISLCAHAAGVDLTIATLPTQIKARIAELEASLAQERSKREAADELLAPFIKAADELDKTSKRLLGVGLGGATGPIKLGGIASDVVIATEAFVAARAARGEQT